MIEKSTSRITITDIIAIVSSIGLIVWIITDFYGGMIIWFLSYGVLILPIVLLYIFSLIETLISTFRKDKRKSRIKLTAHFLVLMTILSLNIYHSEILKSDIVMTAVLKDDLSLQKLTFRENGDVENKVSGMLGFTETYHGKYKVQGNLIIFSVKPYDNDFVPDTLLVNRNQKALFKEKDSNGNFIEKKEWLNHTKRHTN